MTDEQNPAADWWCWTENEPSTFRCRELGHDVRPQRPANEMPMLATSAQLRETQRVLRETQQALAGSQADLTRAKAEGAAFLQERDEAWRSLALTDSELVSARQETGHLRALLDEVIADRSRLRYELEQLVAEEATDV